MSKIGRVLLIIIVSCFIGGIIWLKIREEDVSDKVETIKAKKGDIIVKNYISGEITYAKEVLIKPQISGILKKLYVKEGQSVSKGDKIAQIQIVANPSTVETSDDNVKQAQVNFDLQVDNYDRQKKLFKAGVIAENKVEQAKRDYLLAKQTLTSAKQRYFIAKSGYSEKTHTSNLVFSTARGQVISLPLEEGASIIERNNFNEGSTIAVIASADEVIFKGYINEKDLFNIKEGKPVSITLRALPKKKLSGKINSIAEKASSINGIKKFAFKASINLKDSLKHYIRSGLTAKASVIIKEKKNILTLPERSIVYKGDSTYVKILNGDKTTEKAIRTGLSDGERVEIISGVSTGESVIAEP